MPLSTIVDSCFVVLYLNDSVDWSFLDLGLILNLEEEVVPCPVSNLDDCSLVLLGMLTLTEPAVSDCYP